MSKLDDVEKGFLWVSRVLKYFSHYHPKIIKVSMNYQLKIAKVIFSIEVTDRFKKQLAKIKIPSSSKMKISSTKDMYFTTINCVWNYDENSNEWIIHSKELPTSERYFIEMTGPIPDGFLEDHVQIDRSIQRNRERDDTCDTYWLAASLSQTEDLELVAKAFEIEEVNVDVDVLIDKHVKTIFPKPVENLLQKKFEWDSAADGRRRDLDRLRSQYKTAVRKSTISFEDLVKILNNIVARETFIKYLDTDDPYSIYDIQKKSHDFPPKIVSVQARTTLSLKNQAPKGYLRFYKKDFKDDLTKKFEGTDEEEADP